MGAVGKTMWNSGAEDILLETGLGKQGTADKGFASAGDYYQSMREHKLLLEALANLHVDAFEQWHLEKSNDAQLSRLPGDLQNICVILCILQKDETRFPLTPYSNCMIR